MNESMNVWTNGHEWMDDKRVPERKCGKTGRTVSEATVMNRILELKHSFAEE